MIHLKRPQKIGNLARSKRKNYSAKEDSRNTGFVSQAEVDRKCGHP